MSRLHIAPYASSGEAEYTSQGLVLPKTYQADVYLNGLGNTPYADDVLLDGLADSSLFNAEGGAYERRFSSLEGLDAGLSAATPGNLKNELREVIEAAMEPGTERNRQVGLKLLAKADQITDLMEKRAMATDRIRGEYKKQARTAEAWDKKTLHDINANIHPGVNPSKQAILKIAADRKKAFAAARKGVRMQKANIAASALTANALEQASLLQRMATAVAMGKPSLAAVYGGMYDKMARTSDGLKQIRREQVAKDRASGLSGLEEHLPEDALMQADRAEAELAGQELIEIAFLEGFAEECSDREAALEGLGDLGWGRLRRRIKKAVKKVSSKVKTVAKKATSAVKTAAKKTASSIKNSTIVKNTIKVAKPIANAVKNTVKSTVIAPVKSTVVAARAVARGKPVKSAFKSAAKVMKRAGKDLGKSIGNITVGLACALEDTRLGRAAAQYVGQAVGSVYGGGPTVGGAVGKEVGRKVNETNRAACKGLKNAGLTGEGNFKGLKNVGRSMKAVGKDLRKNVFSKEAMLASAMRIGGNMLGGGYVQVPGTDQLMSFAKDKALEAGKNYVKQKARDISRKVGVNLTKKVLGSKAARVVDRASGIARTAIQKGGADAVRQLSRQYGPIAAQKLAVRAGMNPRVANQITQAGRALADIKRGRTLKLDANTAKQLTQRFGPQVAQRIAIRSGMSPRMSKALVEVAQTGANLSKGNLNRALAQRMLADKAQSVGMRRLRRAAARRGITPQRMRQARQLQQIAKSRPWNNPNWKNMARRGGGFAYRRLTA